MPVTVSPPSFPLGAVPKPPLVQSRARTSRDVLTVWRASVELLEERGHAIGVHRHAAARCANVSDALEGTVRATAHPARRPGWRCGDVSAVSLSVRGGVFGEDSYGILGAASWVLRQVPRELAGAAAQEPILRVCLALLDVEAR